jgi:hypothetical protein
MALRGIDLKPAIFSHAPLNHSGVLVGTGKLLSRGGAVYPGPGISYANYLAYTPVQGQRLMCHVL